VDLALDHVPKRSDAHQGIVAGYPLRERQSVRGSP
jgi:hypothetical protein